MKEKPRPEWSTNMSLGAIQDAEAFAEIDRSVQEGGLDLSKPSTPTKQLGLLDSRLEGSDSIMGDDSPRRGDPEYKAIVSAGAASLDGHLARMKEEMGEEAFYKQILRPHLVRGTKVKPPKQGP